MPAIRRPKLWGIITVCLVVLAVAGLEYGYSKVNDPRTALQIHEENIKYGTDLEVEGIVVNIQKPIVGKRYSKEYSSYVYNYTIPFTAENIAEWKNPFPVENLQIVSAGRVWYGWPEDSYRAKNNVKTKWGDLEPGEKTKGNWTIEVVVDGDIPESLYSKYVLYYLQDEGRTVFKYEFT